MLEGNVKGEGNSQKFAPLAPLNICLKVLVISQNSIENNENFTKTMEKFSTFSLQMQYYMKILRAFLSGGPRPLGLLCTW